MRLTREEFDKKIIWDGSVILEIPSLTANTVKFNGGFLEIAGGTETDKAKQATRVGEIIKLPRRTPEVKTDIFKCRLDAQVGDTAYFDAFQAQNQLTGKTDKSVNDLLFQVEDKMYIAVPSISIVAVKRDGKLIAVNGNCLGEVLPDETITPTGIILPGKKSKYTRVKITSVSREKPEFKNPDLFKNTDVKEGDVVMVENHRPIHLDKTYTNTTDLVRFQSFTVIATE